MLSFPLSQNHFFLKPIFRKFFHISQCCLLHSMQRFYKIDIILRHWCVLRVNVSECVVHGLSVKENQRNNNNLVFSSYFLNRTKNLKTLCVFQSVDRQMPCHTICLYPFGLAASFLYSFFFNQITKE